jgi:hypothetical protein
MLAVQIRTLRQAYRKFQTDSDIKAILALVKELYETFGVQKAAGDSADTTPVKGLIREDLRLICFDLVTGG